ncbi:hypothetical protein DNTS_001698 [Danionella cerebrum]|uniref:VPS37 C-terminal domain-containing protein n=1 Tax=Danionella cerebrum TaxID=2873325 RepID=A0A553QJ75_9TELE|nr:hypothetical protein DNTS_001698 [Danionella translucida]
MAKLQDLSQSELQDLLDNSERVASMALESDEREMALAANRSLAEQNLDMKPRLENDRARLVEKYTELEAGQVSPEGLLYRLQAEGASTEEESERFLSLRSLAHMRRVRIEKLQEILIQKSKGKGDAMVTSHPNANQDAGTTSPWQHQQPQQQQSSKIHPSSNASNPALPYAPYPVAPPSASTTGTTSTAFQPYTSQGAPFPPSSGFSAPRPAFGPPACPYPTQTPFPPPPLGQFGPMPAPYPSAYTPYGGMSYPTGPHAPSTQSSPGRPLYRQEVPSKESTT